MDPATITALVKLAASEAIRKVKKVIDMITKPDETISKLIIYGIIIPLLPIILIVVLICGVHSGVNGYVESSLAEFKESVLYVRIGLVESIYRLELNTRVIADVIGEYADDFWKQKEEEEKEEDDSSTSGEEESSTSEEPTSEKVTNNALASAEFSTIFTEDTTDSSLEGEEDDSEESSELTEEEQKELFDIFHITTDVQVPNLAYTLAYITHADEIESKKGNVFVLEEGENTPSVLQILQFYRNIIEFNKTTYTDADGVEWTEFSYGPKSPLEVGEQFWPDDRITAQMYVASYKRYCEAYDIPYETYNLRNVEMDIPIEYQNGNQTGYGGSTISRSGCGPTCLAMVLSYLTETSITANDIVAWCGEKYYIPGDGTSWAIFPAAAEHWGCSCEQASEFGQVVDAINEGKPVIASMGPGHFTAEGHFIVIRGSTSEGYLLVNDPNSTNYVEHGDKVPADWVIKEAKGYFIFWGGTEDE